MIPAAFEYHTPGSLNEATALLARLGDDAKVLSGGQSLIPLMKLRLSSPRHVVDINGIGGLDGVREADGFLRIGALTRESDLEESEVVRTRYPLLHDTCKVIADPLVRNLATVGGNLAHADPANDHPATMLALGAEVVAVGTKGERTIPITAFFTGPFATALRPDEILVEIRIPTPPARSGGAYLKLERKVGDFATAAVAVHIVLSAGGTCDQVGIGLTNVGLTPLAREPALVVRHNRAAAEQSQARHPRACASGQQAGHLEAGGRCGEGRRRRRRTEHLDRAIDPRLRWTGRRRRDPIYLERVVDEVHDPVLRETGPSVECRLEASIESQARIGDLDHEGRARGMRLEVVLRLAGDNGDIWLRLGVLAERQRRVQPHVPSRAERRG